VLNVISKERRVTHKRKLGMPKNVVVLEEIDETTTHPQPETRAPSNDRKGRFST